MNTHPVTCIDLYTFNAQTLCRGQTFVVPVLFSLSHACLLKSVGILAYTRRSLHSQGWLNSSTVFHASSLTVAVSAEWISGTGLFECNDGFSSFCEGGGGLQEIRCVCDTRLLSQRGARPPDGLLRRLSRVPSEKE